MKAKFLVCCDSVAVNPATRRISLFHIFDRIKADTFPLLIPRICLVAYLEKKKSEANDPHFEIELLLNGARLFKAPFSAKFSHGDRAQGIGEVQGLVIVTPGSLRLQILYRGKALSFFDVQIDHQSAPEREPRQRMRPRRVRRIAPAVEAPRLIAPRPERQ